MELWDRLPHGLLDRRLRSQRGNTRFQVDQIHSLVFWDFRRMVHLLLCIFPIILAVAVADNHDGVARYVATMPSIQATVCSLSKTRDNARDRWERVVPLQQHR